MANITSLTSGGEGGGFTVCKKCILSNVIFFMVS